MQHLVLLFHLQQWNETNTTTTTTTTTSTTKNQFTIQRFRAALAAPQTGGPSTQFDTEVATAASAPIASSKTTSPSFARFASKCSTICLRLYPSIVSFASIALRSLTALVSRLTPPLPLFSALLALTLISLTSSPIPIPTQRPSESRPRTEAIPLSAATMRKRLIRNPPRLY